MLYVQPVYVQSSGDAAYPTLRRVLVGFGEEVGFAPTLEEALDEVFQGDSGAQTSSGAGVDEAEAGSPDGAGEDGAEAPAGGASLEDALSDANQAIQESEEALQDGDWTSYGEAQQRLQDAIERALEADGVVAPEAEGALAPEEPAEQPAE